MYPKEYIDYLVHFHGDRDYFECHEILEEYWKTVDKNNKKSILVAFILLAVCNYHHRRGNFRGAGRTLKKAIFIFNEQKTLLPSFGFLPEPFLEYLGRHLKFIEDVKEYKSMNLPIHDKALIESCKEACKQKGYIWGNESDLTNEDILHRHVRRDRSEVLFERDAALKERQKKGRE